MIRVPAKTNNSLSLYFSGSLVWQRAGIQLGERTTWSCPVTSEVSQVVALSLCSDGGNDELSVDYNCSHNK